MQESLSGIQIVKAFLMELHESKRIARSMKLLIRARVRNVLWAAASGVGAGFFVGIAGLVVVWYGGSEIIRGNLTIGQYVAFNSFLIYIFGPTQRLVNMNVRIQNSLAAVERVFEILDLKPEEESRAGRGDLKDTKGKVEYCNVSFSYDSARLVLEDISLGVEPGNLVALVGRSGAGKTTLVNLIPRFYEPQSGRILIDGNDIQEIALRSLRKQIGIVSQETFLFSSSVKDNIRFGRPNATDEEVIRAAKSAHAHEFIVKLAQGYDTKVGERGGRLSGGERQRIAIARAILKEPPILILDEATSELDSKSENLIQEAMESLMRNRTTFVIAHRLSTILNADTIVVLDEGRIVEEGRHQELYHKGGAYKRLYDEQFAKVSVRENAAFGS